MTTIYRQSVPVLKKYSANFSALLGKGQKWADEQGKPHQEILEFRLREDMRGLIYQVQAFSSCAMMGFERLSGIEHVVVPDDETTFEQLQARLASTIAWIDKLEPAKLEGKEAEPLVMETKMGNFRFASQQDFLSEYMIPNLHFHLTTAYCILRHLGVPIGAFDYMKDVFTKV